MKNSDHSYIADVYYVPAIKHSLLSVGQLMEKDYNGILIVYMKMSKNRMFPLNIQYDAAKCLSVIINNEEWLGT